MKQTILGEIGSIKIVLDVDFGIYIMNRGPNYDKTKEGAYIHKDGTESLVCGDNGRYLHLSDAMDAITNYFRRIELNDVLDRFV